MVTKSLKANLSQPDDILALLLLAVTASNWKVDKTICVRRNFCSNQRKSFNNIKLSFFYGLFIQMNEMYFNIFLDLAALLLSQGRISDTWPDSVMISWCGTNTFRRADEVMIMILLPDLVNSQYPYLESMLKSGSEKFIG